MCSISARSCVVRGIAARWVPRSPSRIFFGQKLQKSKKIGTSNWSAARLNERQILYAANDAHVALQVYYAWQASRNAATQN